MTARIIQTTVGEEPSGLAVAAVFFPKAPSNLRKELDVRNAIKLPRGESENLSRYAYIDLEWILETLFEFEDWSSASLDFLQDFFRSEAIIVEESPPHLASLSQFLTHASGVAIGAYVGTATATALANPLLMFITVPAGMLIIGTASGVGSALEAGLRSKILKLLGAEPREGSSRPSSESEDRPRRRRRRAP